jgi:hypothetical protein
VANVLAIILDPRKIGGLTSFDLDQLLRSARSARLLGTLAARVSESATEVRLHPLVRRHLDSALLEARFRRQKLRFLLSSVAPLILAAAPTSVLLKGAAYAMQHLPIAAGRLPADVDILVPRDRLDAVEVALVSAGWEFQKDDPHDQRYYRDWSHELPPMQCAGQALELDLHHAILPPYGRLRPDPSLLLSDAVPIEGSCFLALSPVDQLLHAAAHLFQDSDCTNRLRDLVDFDGLLRGLPGRLASDGRAVEQIATRADVLELTRPLSYAAAFAHAWLGTPGAKDLAELAGGRARGGRYRIFMRLAGTTLGPPEPDRLPSMRRRFSSMLLEARAAWLRMPPNLLAVHVATKTWRSLVGWMRGDRPAAV